MERLQIYVNEEFCKGCGFCIHFCPTKVLTMSNELSPKGNFVAMVKDPNKCTACRLCELVCPDFAISVETNEEGSYRNSSKRSKGKAFKTSF